MALSKSFFTLRKGSTKSLTFSTYRGQQVTKDRVSVVNNPQSSAQMSQRLIVPMVASARAALKGLVNHSFEGTTYGWQSLQKFSSLNMAKGALDVTAYVPKGAMDCGVANFIVSRGSLSQMSYGPCTVNGVKYAGFNVPYPNFTVELEEAASSYAELETFVRGIFLNGSTNGLVSFLYALKGSSYTWQANGKTYTGYRNPWWLWRLDGSKSFNDLLLDVRDTNTEIIVQFDDDLEIHVPYTITTVGEIHKLSIGAAISGEVEGESNYNAYATLAEGYADTPFSMFAVIKSELADNQWKRSSQRMAVINASAVSESDVLPTYTKSSSAVNSDYFLNEGDKDTYIDGNSGTTSTTDVNTSSTSTSDSSDGGEKTQG